MESLSNRSDVRVLGGIGNNSGKPTNQSICSNENSIMCKLVSEMLKILDLSKTGLPGVLNMPPEEKSASNHTPRFLTTSVGERKLPRIVTGKKLRLSLFHIASLNEMLL